MHSPHYPSSRAFSPAALLCFLCLFAANLISAQEAKRSFDVPAGNADKTLRIFSEQSGRGVIYPAASLKDVQTNSVKGEMTVTDAIQQLTKDTPLVVTKDDKTGAYAIRRETPAESKNDSSRLGKTDQAADGSKVEGGVIKLETFEVMGSKLLNMDKPRSRDDAQPYVVFDRATIEHSQAVTLDDFFRTRLPMNSQKGFTNQSTFGTGITNTNSSINLRGLGTNQTLILVDGRRMPNVTASAIPAQPDLNGIPLTMIERIEVLPSSAGGIYGGSATGGVVNVILRRDFVGAELKTTYTNTFDTDTGTKRIDFAFSSSLEGGRTHVMLSGSWMEANVLLARDRSFIRRAIALQMANNPSLIMNNSTPFPGTTVNIRSVSGNLVLDPAYGGASLGSNITYIPLGYTGPSSDNGAALVANAGKYNLDPADDTGGGRRGLIATPAINSLMLSARRRFTDKLEMIVDLSQTENTGRSFNGNFPSAVSSLPADAPNNPFQQAIAVRFPNPAWTEETHREIRGQHAAIGLIARLPHDWMAELDCTWNRSKQTEFTTTTPVDSGAQAALNTGMPPADGRPALNALQEGNTFPLNFTPYLLPSPSTIIGPNYDVLSNESFRLGGPVFQLPGGPLALTALAEHRKESLNDQLVSSISASTRSWSYILFPGPTQDVYSYYSEAHAPLIAKANAVPGMQALDLQLSVRRDEYQTRAPSPTSASLASLSDPRPVFARVTNSLASSNYTLAASYAPTSDLVLRVSVNTGFLPAAVNQLVKTSRTLQAPGASLGFDPKRGNTEANVGLPITLISGGNPNLQPEESRSVSAGVILTPRGTPGLRLSLDYTRIRKTNEITAPDRQLLLNAEDQFPGRIIRGSNLPGDPAGWAGVVTTYDTSLINIAHSEIEAFDIQADYTRNIGQLGSLHSYAIATYQPHYWQQSLPTAGIQENAGFSNGPLKWRGNIGLDWKMGRWTVGWNAQYYHSYYVYNALPTPLTAPQIASRATTVLNQGSDTIARQMYHDLVVTYRFDSGVTWFRWLADCEVSIGLQNIFNTLPPVVAISFVGDNDYSLYGDPRLRRYSLSLRKRFGW